MCYVVFTFAGCAFALDILRLLADARGSARAVRRRPFSSSKPRHADLLQRSTSTSPSSSLISALELLGLGDFFATTVPLLDRSSISVDAVDLPIAVEGSSQPSTQYRASSSTSTYRPSSSPELLPFASCLALWEGRLQLEFNSLFDYSLVAASPINDPALGGYALPHAAQSRIHEADDRADLADAGHPAQADRADARDADAARDDAAPSVTAERPPPPPPASGVETHPHARARVWGGVWPRPLF